LNQTLVLLTEKYPCEGGEVFLRAELPYLSDYFQKIIIIPSFSGNKIEVELPPNVEVLSPPSPNNHGLRNSLRNYGIIILRLFATEFIFSPKRIKYLTQFKWNLYRLVGLLKEAEVLLKLLKTTLSNEQAIVYSYWFNEQVSRAVLVKMMGYRFKLITRVHLYDFEEEFNGRGYLPFRYSEWKKVDGVLPISTYAHNYLRRQFGKDRRLKDVSRLGVAPTTSFNRGGTVSRFTIVSCSVLSWYKRPQLLVEIISKLEVPVKWVHFGGGMLEPEFLEAAKKLLANVEFEYRGQVPNAHILQFYKENGVDLFINVSAYEGIPYSMMEAIAAGIPLVGCDVCGVPEIVMEQTGLLLPKAVKAETAAKNIETFLIEKSRDFNFRKQIVQFWSENYSAEVNYRSFVSQLQSE
jgi:colanic acid/amylovoran biosynthesis glycosyltransferase